MTVEGPDVRLKPRIATMLSLAIHELAENALHHGSLSNLSGTVHIGWTVDNDTLDFAWRERGGPAVSQPSRTGYGTRIVERVLAAEFAGTAVIDYAPEGLSFQLQAPLQPLGHEATSWTFP